MAQRRGPPTLPARPRALFMPAFVASGQRQPALLRTRSLHHPTHPVHHQSLSLFIPALQYQGGHSLHSCIPFPCTTHPSSIRSLSPLSRHAEVMFMSGILELLVHILNLHQFCWLRRMPAVAFCVQGVCLWTVLHSLSPRHQIRSEAEMKCVETIAPPGGMRWPANHLGITQHALVCVHQGGMRGEGCHLAAVAAAPSPSVVQHAPVLRMLHDSPLLCIL